MKKIAKVGLILLIVVFSVGVIWYIYWPFAERFINEISIAGDAVMHLANIFAFVRNHPFVIMAWKTEWGGYPVVEGYPWLHYYLIQPFINYFRTPGIALDHYMTYFLFAYYIASFITFFYVSRKASLALLFTLVLIYGADSHLPMTVNAFMTFTATMFLLPLTLLLVLIAKEKKSTKILLLSVLTFSLSYYSHGAMTGIIIFPSILPFLVFNNKGKITKDSITLTIRYFFVFALLSGIQIYQFIDYSAQGYLRGVKPLPLDTIPSRFIELISWQNPVFLVLLIVFIPFILITVFKSFSRIKPFLFSFLALYFFFILMLFNITSMNLVLLAERALWSISFVFLVLCARTVYILANKGIVKSVIVEIISLSFVGGYLFLTLIVKPDHLVPDTLRSLDPYMYKSKRVEKPFIFGEGKEYTNKYDFFIYDYILPDIFDTFDNYRTDGINWAVYSNWNIWSDNPRYKGRFPAAKNLPLEWSGLVSASQYGLLGEAGTPDDSIWALNQTFFFFDWYGIRYLEVVEADWPQYLRTEPIIVDTEINNHKIYYYTIDEKLISPIYAPTDAKLMAVVAPESLYDYFIRTLSYSDYTSEKLIPIYIGSSLGALKERDIDMYDSVYLYGYKSFLSYGKWDLLLDFVRNGGNLIIETGQKVPQTQNVNLPEVFPVKATKLTVVNKEWSMKVEENIITEGVEKSDFAPFVTKYLPYSVSEAMPDDLKDWAKSVLTKDGSTVLAYGQLGEGKVAWSGINLPFHAIDNRNTSETVIFANILDWFFPETNERIVEFEVAHPNPETIMVKTNDGKGVLIKENYNSGWVARVNGKKTKIYKAGLFEMYIPLDNQEGEKIVELKYYGNPIHWVLFIVSVITFIGIILYMLFNINPIPWFTKKIKLGGSEHDNY